MSNIKELPLPFVSKMFITTKVDNTPIFMKMCIPTLIDAYISNMGLRTGFRDIS